MVRIISNISNMLLRVLHILSNMDTMLLIMVSLSLSHWYPGSGVVLDCIDS